jgi:8-oxo-dGTP diphosphatase
MQGKDYIGAGVGAMIFNDRGELLLAKRGKEAKNERGHWEVPGGSIEFGETMAEAVVREIKEELGIDIVVEQQLLALDHLIPDENQHWVTTPFIVRVKPGQSPKILEPHKCETIEWFALDNLPEPLSIATRLNIEVYEQHLNQRKKHAEN